MSDAGEPGSERGLGEAAEARSTPSSRDGSATDPRILAAWREWLRALASDADAAIAAADVYAELAPVARDSWLDALAEDAPSLSVPLVAIYAPLLAVESDPERRSRMEAALAFSDPGAFRGRPVRALSAIATSGARVVALVQPVYLRFVRVLWCRFLPDEGVFWARHDSLLSEADAPRCGTVVDGLALETAPLPAVVEELAHAILAHRRRGAEHTASLREFTDLFDTEVEAIDGVV